MRDLAYEDLEIEAAREREETEEYEAKLAKEIEAKLDQDVLDAQEAKEYEARELADRPPGHMEAGFLIGFLKSAANSKIRTNEVRYFALEVLAALHKDCK